MLQWQSLTYAVVLLGGSVMPGVRASRDSLKIQSLRNHENLLALGVEGVCPWMTHLVAKRQPGSPFLSINH
jgi:hypothetical protein